MIVDRDGSQHVRYDRTHRGLPVLGGDFVVHLARDGAYRGANRATRSALSPSTTPRLSASKAAGLAAYLLRAVNPGETLRKLTARPQLVVDAARGARAGLAHRSGGTGLAGQPGRPHRAHPRDDRRADRRVDSLESASDDGRSLYGGTVPLETTRSGSAFRLEDPTRGGTYTADAGDRTDLRLLGSVCLTRAPATVFTDADNHWGSGAASDRATASVDAQYGTDTTRDISRTSTAATASPTTARARSTVCTTATRTTTPSGTTAAYA